MWQINSNFTKGELDPQLAGRTDLESYYQGVKLARNYILIPQGGMKSRDGMEYIATAANGRLEPFIASDGTEYLLHFYDTKMAVYKSDVLQTNINGGGNSYLTISHSLAQILEADIIQSGDTLLIFHPDVTPHKIVTSGDTTWTLSTSFLTNIPQYDFNDNYSPIGTAEVQTLTFTNTNNSDRFKLMLEGILTDEFVFSGVGTAALQNSTANNIREVLQDHPLLKGKSISVAYVAGLQFSITLDSGLPYPINVISATPIQTQNVAADGLGAVSTAGVSSAEDVWSSDLSYAITGATQANPCVVTVTGNTFNNGDQITITGVSGMTQLNGNTYTVANRAANTVELLGINSTGYGAYTSGGTATRLGRGWPRCATFHQGRLYVAGTDYLPSFVWGSNVNDYFNYRTGRALDDNAIGFSLDTDRVNRIQNIFSNKTLQIFSDQGEFYVDASPITPTSLAVKPQTQLGSKRVRPVNVEGATYFLQWTGKALMQFEYVDTVASNKTTSISLLAPHLVKDPVQMAVRQGSTTLDATYCYLVNGDGTVTVLNSLSSQNIQAFTRWETDGLIKSVCVLGDDLYFLVSRSINSSTVYYIEKENSLLAYDCAKRTTGIGGATMSGLTHLNGETVKVRALTSDEVNAGYEGGSILDDELVAAGSITVGASYDTIEAGLDYTVEAETMPLNVQTQFGNSTFKKTRIFRAAFDFYESAGFAVNGEEISTLTIGTNQFDAPQPFTGVKRLHIGGGYSIGPTITFGRATAHRHQILSLGLEVKT